MDALVFHKPVVDNVRIRFGIGFSLVLAASCIVAVSGGIPFFSIFPPVLMAWLFSTWLTDKYVHKYPRRYYSYLLASQGKAAAIMIVSLLFLALFPWFTPHLSSILRAALLVLLADVLFSLPRTRTDVPSYIPQVASAAKPQAPASQPESVTVNTAAICDALENNPLAGEFKGLSAFLRDTLPPATAGFETLEIVDTDFLDPGNGREQQACILLKKSVNSLKRLNIFMKELPNDILMGGFFVSRYSPMDEQLESIRSNNKGLALWWAYGSHFVWFRMLPKIPNLEKVYFSKYLSWLDTVAYRLTRDKRRVLARAEMWGRLYYWGFEVLGERRIGNDYWVVSRRFRQPVTDRKPSFYLVVRLTKVGLGGQRMHLHKLRSMYPFSEFLQEKIYKDHGLSNTGKFKNDFRLTDYGGFIRRFWLDEIPQIFDFLRGDIKLVGMRATSPQFLSLYPQEFYDLYIQTKPGLIPPIFDSNTNGFDDIVRVELEYLRDYQKHPLTTDVKYFFKTLHDIFIRGVRSK